MASGAHAVQRGKMAQAPQTFEMRPITSAGPDAEPILGKQLAHVTLTGCNHNMTRVSPWWWRVENPRQLVF